MELHSAKDYLVTAAYDVSRLEYVLQTRMDTSIGGRCHDKQSQHLQTFRSIIVTIDGHTLKCSILTIECIVYLV